MAGEGDQVVLHLREGGEGRGIQAIGGREHREGIQRQGVDVGPTGVIDIRQGAATVGGQIGSAQALQRGPDVVVGHGLGQC